MKIATWNINSIRMRLQHLRDFLTEVDPDIVLLQEIKCETEKFPFDELSDLAYNLYVHGQKSYNGVAILSKFPADEVIKDFPTINCLDQARLIEITVQTPIGFCSITSLYAPNGSLVGSDKFEMKLRFYDDLTNYLQAKKSLNTKIIIGGDFNIAPFDIDVYSAKELQNITCFTNEEKQRLRIILNSGFEDLYRLSNPTKQEFSWWDYRAGCFEQNKGMRIDMILASSNVADYLDNCYMYYNLRAKVKPSDHIPVVAIVNSGEFGARSDGAMPISNRRALSDDVPNFSSIDYNAYSTLRRLIVDHIKPYLKQIGIAVLFMVVNACCNAYIVELVQPTIDQIFLTHNRQMLLFLPLMVVLTFTIKGIAEYYSSYLIKFVGQRILTDLQIKMYEHLLFADILFIQSQSSGRLISRFTNDISMMRGAVSNILVCCAKHFLTVLGLIIVMFRLEPKLSCIVFMAFPAAIYPTQQLGRKIRKISGQAQEELANYTSRLDETFGSIKIVKSFLGEKIESNRALLISSNILRFLKKTAKLDALISPLMEILSGITVGGLIWYGGLLVIEGETTPGALFAFITAFITAYRPFKSLVSLNINLQEGIAATRRIFNILDTEPVIKDSVNALTVPLVNPSVVFNNVELKFNNKVALKHLNLQLMQGKTTAVIGRSGSGKTSLANLLVRFYNPTSGQILIDDYDIKDIKIDSLRRQISLVTQDTTLFDTSVAENIAYGNPDATRSEIITAAKYADADEFISQLPFGYDTMIGNQGSTLSGGQRQRLAIARAFLKPAAILVWDEATSSLDQNSERLILNSLVNLRKGKTTLIVTHRLSSIKDVDHIVVMKSGMIFEQGTHSQLIENKAEYYKLYHKELGEGEK